MGGLVMTRFSKLAHNALVSLGTRRIGLALVGLLTMATLPQVAHADIVFSNFSPSNGSGFNTLSGYSVTGITSPIGVNVSVASSFIPSANYTLTSFEVAAIHNGTLGTNSYNFSIVRDNAGLPTGSTIASVTSVAVSDVVFPAISLLSTTASLQSGTTYWLVMQPGASNSFGAWQKNNIGQIGFSRNSGSGWVTDPLSIAPAFRINGSPASSAAPEPCTLALFTLGGLGVLAKRRRK
jgi:hypothetical protein